MSTIDLHAGYWQVPVPVAEEDKDKTCFTTCFGTVRFKHMPIGLKNAPATFMRLMDRFRSTLGKRNIIACMDDILISAKTFEDHITDLEAVFSWLMQCKLGARREKCSFFRDSIKYFGHIITPLGIKVDTGKVAGIQQMEFPKFKKKVLSFIQTCSWYRKFTPDFTKLHVARPLTNLAKKNVEFKFVEEELQAFNMLKKN